LKPANLLLTSAAAEPIDAVGTSVGGVCPTLTPGWAAPEQVLARAVGPAVAGAAYAPSAGVARAYGALPLSFEINRGQTARQVRFLVRTRDYTAFLTPTEAVFAIQSNVSRPCLLSTSDAADDLSC